MLPARIVWPLVLLVTLATQLLWPRFAIEGDLSKLLPDPPPPTLANRMLLVVLHGDRDLEPLVAALRASPLLERVVATREEAQQLSPWTLPERALAALEERLGPAGIEQAISELDAVLADPFAGKALVREDPLGLRLVLGPALADAFPVPLAPESPFFVLRDHSHALIQVVGRREPFDIEFSRELLADLRARLGEREHTLVGGYAIAEADERRIRRDLWRNCVSSLVLVSLFLVWSTRSVIQPLVLLLPVGLAIAWALPLGGWLLGPLSPLAISAAAILTGLGIDCTIHWSLRYAEERQAVATTRGLFRPMLASLLTTLAAFLALLVSRFHGLAGFGVLLALGLGLTFVLTFLLMPSLVRLVPPRGPSRFELALTAWPAPRGLAWLVLGLAAAGLAVTLTKGLTFTTDPRAMRPADDPLLRIQEAAIAKLGFAPLPVTIPIPASADRDQVARGIESLVAGRTIVFAAGPGASAARIARFGERTHGWRERALAAAERHGYVAAELAPAFDRLARSLAAAPPAQAGGEVQVFLARPLQDLASWWAFRAEVQAALGFAAQPLSSIGLMEQLRDVLVVDLVRATLIAGLAILVLTFALVRGLANAARALVPVLIGLAVTLGAASAFDIQLQLGNFVAIPFVLGLGIDYGIHHVVRPTRAVQIAIWRTSMTTLLGFGSLITSATPGLATLGILTAIGVLVCAFVPRTKLTR